MTVEHDSKSLTNSSEGLPHPEFVPAPEHIYESWMPHVGTTAASQPPSTSAVVNPPPAMPAETPKEEPKEEEEPLAPQRRTFAVWRRFRMWIGGILAGLALYTNRLYVHYRVEVDDKAKCPACGKRKKHKIIYSVMHQALLHQCSFCSAAWGEHPLVPAQAWTVAGMPEEEQQQHQQGPMPPLRTVGRTPVRIESLKEPVRPGTAPKPVMYN